MEQDRDKWRTKRGLCSAVGNYGLIMMIYKKQLCCPKMFFFNSRMRIWERRLEITRSYACLYLILLRRYETVIIRYLNVVLKWSFCVCIAGYSVRSSLFRSLVQFLRLPSVWRAAGCVTAIQIISSFIISYLVCKQPDFIRAVVVYMFTYACLYRATRIWRILSRKEPINCNLQYEQFLLQD